MKNEKQIMKVAVAMSGGVDSSVAAVFAINKYGSQNVIGVTAKFFCYSNIDRAKACCSTEAIDDARAVCEKLGIAHYVISEEKEFKGAVIKNFIEAYRHGQTPIPCIPCNSIIKFGTMLKHVKKLGAEKLITGHYARIRTVQNKKEKIKRYKLLRGKDRAKDQSYFLCGLSQEQLSQVEFPIGEMTKGDVRYLAKKHDLKTAEKQESQGVCFVSEGTVADWLSKKIKPEPGDIVNTKGEKMGRHNGYIFYTIGQRKRIGGGYEKPMFVIKLNPLKNEVVIGPKDELYDNNLIVGSVNWINEPKLPLRCTAKIRYNMDDAESIVKIQNSDLKTKKNHSKFINSKLNRNSKLEIRNYAVTFSEPQRAITPGQSVVFYDGEVCLGGGIIS